MATRTVHVNLKADVAGYIRDVEAASAATRGLRNDAERFEDRYTATLNVNSRGANRSLQRTNRSLSDTIIRIENLKSSVRSLAIPPAFFASLPQLASLGASAVDAAGAINLLPAAGFAAAAGLGAIAIGAMGWEDALKSLTGEQEAFNTALESLAPSAQETARVLRDMSGEWMRMAGVVQDDLFADTADSLRELGVNYLPMVESRLAPIAGELGDAANAFAEFANRADTVRDASEGMDLLREAAQRIEPIFVNLSAVVRDMAIVGARELPGIADGFEDATGRLRDFIAEARRSGDLQEWIQNGVAATAQWGRVFRQTGSIINSVFHAADDSGVNFLDTLERVTARTDQFLDSAPGEARLVAFFSEMREVGDALLPGLQALGRAAASVVESLSDSGTITGAAAAFSSLAEGAEPAIGMLGELASTILPPLLGLIEQLGPFLGPAAAGFLALRSATRGIGNNAAGVGRLTQSLGGSADAAGRLTRVASGLARGLPILGAAAAGVIFTIRELQVSAEDAATAIAKGGPAAEKMRTEFNETNDSMRSWLTVIPILGTYLSELVDDENDLTAALTEQEAKQAELTRTQQRADETLRIYQQAVSNFGASSPQAVVALMDYENAVGALEWAQNDAGVATDGHTAAVERQRNQFLGSEAAGLRWLDTIDRATESVNRNGVTVDRNTAAGRANREALLGMARAAIEDIGAKEAQGATTQEITALTNNHRQQLFDTAVQMGMSREEANRYVEQLSLVPPSQTTTFHVPGLAEAITGVRDLSDLINGMQNVARDNLTGAVSDAIDAIPGRASGGPVNGPGSSTSDSILMRLSNGEWVMRQRAVAEQGQDKMAALNAGRADIVPRRASGGPVNTDVTLDFRGAADAVKRHKNEMFPPMPAWSGGGGVEQWRGVVMQALSMMGQPASYAGITLRRMNQESGGNPTIVNNWDINAQRGTPSVGLMQTIGPTYAAYADPRRNLGMTDPLSNILASMRYALARYGSLPAAYNRAGGYRDGGTIPGVGDRDNKMIAAQSGERVLTRGQNLAFEEMVSRLDRPTPLDPRIGGASGGGGDTNVEINNENHFTEAVDLDLFNQRQDFAVRSASF